MLPLGPKRVSRLAANRFGVPLVIWITVMLADAALAT